MRPNLLNRQLLFFLALVLVLKPVLAQEDTCDAGIFKTSSDLLKNRMTHKVPGKTRGYKFGFLFPADLKLTIKITTPDTTLEYPPGSVFGYSQCGRKHRYYKGGDLLAQEDFYRIEEMGGLIIYSSVFVSGDERFYSQGIEAPVRRLLLRNIEEDFAKYPSFVESVKELNKTGLIGDLAKMENGKYEINRLYAQEIGKKAR